MPIKKIVIKEYAVVCDECGEEMYPEENPQIAVKNAIDAGWAIIDKSMCPYDFYCPECRIKLEEKP